jgi:hypothetical protein
MNAPLNLLFFPILVVGPYQGWMVASAQEKAISKEDQG